MGWVVQKMPADSTILLLKEINDHTRRIEEDQKRMWDLFEKKSDKDETIRHNKMVCDKITEAKKEAEEAKRIAANKLEKDECKNLHEQTEARMKEVKDDMRNKLSVEIYNALHKELSERIDNHIKEQKSDSWNWAVLTVSVVSLLVSIGVAVAPHIHF